MTFEEKPIDNQKICVIIFLTYKRRYKNMALPDEIFDFASKLNINDFDSIGYAYSGHTTNNETEIVYFLPLDLKTKEIITFEVPSGFCKKFDQQLKMGIKRSAPLILAATLNISDIDKVPLELFSSSDFTKCCLTLMSNSMVLMTKQSAEVLHFKSEIKRSAEWRNNLRIKLRDKMTEAKKQEIIK